MCIGASICGAIILTYRGTVGGRERVLKFESSCSTYWTLAVSSSILLLPLLTSALATTGTSLFSSIYKLSCLILFLILRLGLVFLRGLHSFFNGSLTGGAGLSICSSILASTIAGITSIIVSLCKII